MRWYLRIFPMTLQEHQLPFAVCLLNTKHCPQFTSWDVNLWLFQDYSVWGIPDQTVLTDSTVFPNLPALFGEGNGTPLQYSCLANPMDKGAWYAAVHGVAKSRTWLSNFTFSFHFHALEKEMATPSSVLAWRIPGMEEPGGLPSMGWHRVGHNWSDLAAAAAEFRKNTKTWCHVK